MIQKFESFLEERENNREYFLSKWSDFMDYLYDIISSHSEDNEINFDTSALIDVGMVSMTICIFKPKSDSSLSGLEYNFYDNKGSFLIKEKNPKFEISVGSSNYDSCNSFYLDLIGKISIYPIDEVIVSCNWDRQGDLLSNPTNLPNLGEKYNIYNIMLCL
jgi:hypothetical protein